MDAQAFSQAMRLLREAKTAEDSGNEESEEESQERWEAFDDITDYIISPNRFATLFDSARTLQRTSYENTVYDAMLKTLKPKQLHTILHDFSDVDTKVLKKFVGDNTYDQEKVHAELAKRGSSVRQKTPSPPREISRSPPASTSVFSLSDMSGRGKGGVGLGKGPVYSRGMQRALEALDGAKYHDDDDDEYDSDDVEGPAAIQYNVDSLLEGLNDITSHQELAKLYEEANMLNKKIYLETIDRHMKDVMTPAELKQAQRKGRRSQSPHQDVTMTYAPVTSVYKAPSPIHVRDSVSPPREIYRTPPAAPPAAATYAAAYTPVTYDQFMHAAGTGVFSTFTRGLQLYNKPLQLGEALVLAAENNKEFITQDLLGETLVFPDESNKDSTPHTVATYPGIPDNYLTDANHYAISHNNEQMKNQLMRYVDKNNPRLLIQFLRRSMRDRDEDRAVRIARLIKKNRTDLSREDVELQEYVNSVETEKIPSRAPRPQVSTKPPQSVVRTLATTRPSPPRQSAAASTFTAHPASTFTAHPSVESSIKALRAADKEAGTIFLAAARSGDTDTMLRFVKLEEFAHLRWMSKALVLAAQYGHTAKMHFLFE